MSVGVGSAGAVVVDLARKSGIEVSFHELPGANVSLDDGDKVGENVLYGKEEDDVFLSGYGIICGGLLLGGYVGIGRSSAVKANDWQPGPGGHGGEDLSRKILKELVEKIADCAGENKDLRYEKFARGVSIPDAVSGSVMINSSRRFEGKLDIAGKAKEIEAILDAFKVGDDKIKAGSQYVRYKNTVKYAGVTKLFFRGNFITLSNKAVYISASRGSCSKPKDDKEVEDIIKKMIDETENKDKYFMFEKAKLGSEWVDLD